MILAWVPADAGSILGTAVAVLLPSGAIRPESWKLGGGYAASYIGGGVNYIGVGMAYFIRSFTG